MAAPTRTRSLKTPISRIFTLAAADDLNGVQDDTKTLDVTGNGQRVIISSYQGTLGTAGVDILAVSTDGGLTYSSDLTLLPIDSDDATGTFSTSGALEAAGVDPITNLDGLYKAGPYEGPTKLRIFRYVTDFATTASPGTYGGGTVASAAWVTGAPNVTAIVIGGETGTPT